MLPKYKQMQAELLAKVPPSATRVLVITDNGKQKYRVIDDVTDTDSIQVNKLGDPVVMLARPGRRHVPVVSPPSSSPPASVASRAAEKARGDISARKRTVLDVDIVVRKAREAPDSPDVLHEVLVGLAEEAAAIKFDRDEAAREGKDAAGHSSRRVQALRAVGDVWLKRMEQLTGKVIDLETPAFEVLFEFMVHTLRGAMDAAKMRPEQIETVFAKFSSVVGSEEWRGEAKNRMKHVV